MQGGSVSNGGNAIQTTNEVSNGSNEWCFVQYSQGVYQIMNKNSDLALDVQSFSTNDGGNVHQVLKNLIVLTYSGFLTFPLCYFLQWNFLGNPNQLWSITDTTAVVANPGCADFPPNTIYHIVAQHSGLGLGVNAVNTYSGGAVVQVVAGSSSTGNDSWRFVAKSNGFYTVLIQHSGLALTGTFRVIRELVF